MLKQLDIYMEEKKKKIWLHLIPNTESSSEWI